MRRVTSRRRLVSWDAFDATLSTEIGNDEPESDQEDYGCFSSFDYLHKNESTSNASSIRKSHSGIGSRYAGDLHENAKKDSNLSNNCNHLNISLSCKTLASIDIIPMENNSVQFEEEKFLRLNQDTFLDVVSFLPLSCVLSLSSTNHSMRNFLSPPIPDTTSEIYEHDAVKNAIWMPFLKRKYGWLKHDDDKTSISFASVNQQNLNSRPQSYGSIWSRLTPTPVATQIDSSFLCQTSTSSNDNPDIEQINNDGLGSGAILGNIRMDRRAIRNSQKQLQSMFSNYTLNKNDTLKNNIEVIQFNGKVGSGNRCVTTDSPLALPLQQNISLEQLQSQQRMDSNKNCTTRKYRKNIWRNKDIFGYVLNSSRKSNKRGFFTSSPRSIVEMMTFNDPHLHRISPFVSPYICHSEKGKSGAIQIDICPRMIAYFEVSILKEDNHIDFVHGKYVSPNANRGDERSFLNGNLASNQFRRTDCVAVGISIKNFKTSDRMPGWDSLSYGYHGDDGGIFHGSGDMLRMYGPQYGQGDTIGCGVNYSNGGIFFTLNGIFLGYAWIEEKIVQEGYTELFPTIGIDTKFPISCNFGNVCPFVFDLKGFVKNGFVSAVHE